MGNKQPKADSTCPLYCGLTSLCNFDLVRQEYPQENYLGNQTAYLEQWAKQQSEIYKDYPQNLDQLYQNKVKKHLKRYIRL